MATPEEIREELKKQAGQRVNPLLKGLSMLTGGIAGEFTGTNEQIRQQRQAKRALMEENLAALQEQRMMERMRAQQDEMLKRQIQIDEAQRLAASQTREKEFQQKREAQRPALIGQLRSRPDYQPGGSMAMPIPALEPIESLEEQAAYEEARMKQEEEARKQRSGYMQYTVPGRGTIGGTPEQIAAMAEKDPVLRAFISKPPSDELPFTTTWDRDPITGAINPNIRFTKPVPFAQQKALVEQFFGEQSQGFGTPPPPAGTAGKPEEEKTTDIPGFKVRMK